jgi:hypothetical protein
LHSLLHAGLSRRTALAIYRSLRIGKESFDRNHVSEMPVFRHLASGDNFLRVHASSGDGDRAHNVAQRISS